jgi:hypothetical protein
MKQLYYHVMWAHKYNKIVRNVLKSVTVLFEWMYKSVTKVKPRGTNLERPFNNPYGAH